MHEKILAIYEKEMEELSQLLTSSLLHIRKTIFSEEFEAQLSLLDVVKQMSGILSLYTRMSKVKTDISIDKEQAQNIDYTLQEDEIKNFKSRLRQVIKNSESK